MNQAPEYTLPINTDSGISMTGLRWICLISGVLGGLSFPPYGLFGLGWFFLIPVLLSAQLLTARDAFINAWLFYFGVYAVAFNWPMLHFRTDTAVASAVAWLALTMFQATAIGLASSLSNRYRQLPTIYVAGFLILVVELLLRLGPVPMPGTSVGYSQTMSGIIIRSASVIGANGITVAVIMCNCCLAIALLKNASARLYSLLAAAGIVGTVVFIGLLSPTLEPGESLSVLVIQPGYTPRAWSDVEEQSRVLSMMTTTDSMLSENETNVDLILWPETTLPIVGAPFNDSILIDSLTTWTTTRELSLLTGAVTSHANSGDSTRHFQNSAILFQPGMPATAISKRILVPFAEYVPFSAVAPFLNRLAVPAGGVNGYTPSDVPSVFQLGGLRLGVIICFESHFPEYVSSLTKEGSEILVLLTQNGWWRGSAPYEQNFNYARFRASEQGRSIVVASVDGISGVIGPLGNVLYSTDRRSEAWFTSEVSTMSANTVYTRYGYLIYWLFMGIWGSYLVFNGLRKKASTFS